MRGFRQITTHFSSVSLSFCPLLFSSFLPPSPTDIDECQVHNGGCQHRCVNTRGSYYCECLPGSRLHVDGRTCLGEKQEHHSFVALLIFYKLDRRTMSRHTDTDTVKNEYIDRICLGDVTKAPITALQMSSGRHPYAKKAASAY